MNGTEVGCVPAGGGMLGGGSENWQAPPAVGRVGHFPKGQRLKPDLDQRDAHRNHHSQEVYLTAGRSGDVSLREQACVVTAHPSVQRREDAYRVVA